MHLPEICKCFLGFGIADECFWTRIIAPILQYSTEPEFGPGQPASDLLVGPA